MKTLHRSGLRVVREQDSRPCSTFWAVVLRVLVLLAVAWMVLLAFGVDPAVLGTTARVGGALAVIAGWFAALWAP